MSSRTQRRDPVSRRLGSQRSRLSGRSGRDDDRERIMATDIRVPTLGESVTEATIGRWFKKPGEPIKADEPLVELETDKVTLEVNAPSAGTLGDIVAKDGETVTPGAVLGSIVEGGAASTSTPSAKPAEAPKAAAPQPAAASSGMSGRGGTSAGYGSHGEAAPPTAARAVQD